MELESKGTIDSVVPLSSLPGYEFTEDMTYLYIPTLADHPVC